MSDELTPGRPKGKTREELLVEKSDRDRRECGQLIAERDADLKAIKGSAEKNVDSYNFDGPDANVLAVFPTPESKWGSVLRLHIEQPEFTSLCPITGQPDFATIVIDYTPKVVCIESKALKLYLMGYRNHGAFHESCINQIFSDLMDVLHPYWLRVHGKFTPRGGIPFHPTAEYMDESIKDGSVWIGEAPK